MGRGAGPKFLHMKIFKNRAQPSDVVFVRMGQGDYIETPDGAAPQVGRDHILADIELGFAGSPRADAWVVRPHSEGGDSAAIHEHQLAVGKRNEDAITLAYVDR